MTRIRSTRARTSWPRRDGGLLRAAASARATSARASELLDEEAVCAEDTPEVLLTQVPESPT